MRIARHAGKNGLGLGTLRGGVSVHEEKPLGAQQGVHQVQESLRQAAAGRVGFPRQRAHLVAPVRRQRVVQARAFLVGRHAQAHRDRRLGLVEAE